MSPMSWYCGSQDTTTVLPSACSSLIINVRLWARFSWEIITPLGSLVDPEVYCRNAMFSGKTVGNLTAALDLLLSTVFPFFSVSSTLIHFRSGQRALSVENMCVKSTIFLAKLYDEFVSTVLAPQLSWIFTKWWRSFFSLRGSGGNTGTPIKPALKHASRDTVKSSPGKNTSRTRSPTLNLWEFNKFSAKWDDALSSSCGKVKRFLLGSCVKQPKADSNLVCVTIHRVSLVVQESPCLLLGVREATVI